MDDYMDYLVAIWAGLPYVFYAFVFLTLVPKSIRRILDFAEVNYEMNRYKYHRCYGPDLCCHAYDTDLMPKQKPRKAVTRVYPKRQNQMQSLAKAYDGDGAGEENKQYFRKDYSTATTRSSSKTLTTATATSTSAYKKQFHTHTNVNKIAKMFENGGVQKKINRVTPTTILTTPTLRRSSRSSATTTTTTTPTIDSDGDIEDEEAYYSLCKKNSYITAEGNENPYGKIEKYDKQVQQKLKQQKQTLTDDLNENVNDDFVHQQQQQQQLSFTDTDWCGEPIIHKTEPNEPHQIPTSLTFSGTSVTPSTASPNHLTPYSLSTSPTNSAQHSPSPSQDDNHSLLNDYQYTLSITSSLEDIFAALARNAEKIDQSFHMAHESDNPLSAPVTSIDDILSQRRLSRPLSAYSISDLLNDEITANAIYPTNNDNYNHNLNIETVT